MNGGMKGGAVTVYFEGGKRNNRTREEKAT